MEVAEPEVQQLGRYRIERTLGAGGMGIVYLARDSKLQRPVAIKKLRKDTTSATAAQRIQSEAQLLAQLNHPNIVQLHDVLEEGDSIALVMEYVEGTTLQQWMREHTPSLQQKLELLIQICNGLSEAHSLGIIHRDLKPDNILITDNGVANITDFGIAKSLQQDVDSITREDQVAGTVEAMSPEQLQGYPLDPRSDLFSLGTIAYELLCGARPFEKGDGGAMALAHRVISDPHIPPQQAWPKLPEPLAVLLDRLLGKLPEQRPDSAAQVAEALTFLQQHSAGTDTREFSATVTQLLRKPPNKRKRVFAALAGLAILASAGYWGWKEITRLEPQYIAVLPVEIHGEVRGEDNAKALTKTMVRQALMNATSQLKASALVSFIPKEGQDFDAQLQALRDKGVTDALFARLECAQIRCEIELQRIGPEDGLVKKQSDFRFLVERLPAAEAHVLSVASSLFGENYLKASPEDRILSSEDYETFLKILTKLNNRQPETEHLDTLELLIRKYPQKTDLYHAYAELCSSLFSIHDDQYFLEKGLTQIASAKAIGAIQDQALLLEMETKLRIFNSSKEKIESLIEQLNQIKFPSANLLTSYARTLFINGQYNLSLEKANEAKKLNPSAYLSYLIALNHTSLGNNDKAKEILKAEVQLNSEHWPSYAVLAGIEIESGNYLAAEKIITKIPEQSLNWRTQSNLAGAYFLQKRYKEAEQTYRKVLENTPNNLAPLQGVAESALMKGDIEASQKYFSIIENLTTEKSNPRDLLYRSLALAHLRKFTEAIDLIQRLTIDSPDDVYTNYYAAQIYTLAGELHTASHYIVKTREGGLSADWFFLPEFNQVCAKREQFIKASNLICSQ
ncbi:serine/threonine-protein kinase [Microbulbifer marinus]|uniref:Serine/threonine protein kinase n=1 Tax=Microbulbifer marinus TaxID=658218 RepID=A0A1H4BBL2_9GAMM|nr:serine/threonine-protein kinase [Microbulbifer marinus]SEA45507.1 serine/threonine protein kinase [Microbulbifer marinus]